MSICAIGLTLLVQVLFPFHRFARVGRGFQQLVGKLVREVDSSLFLVRLRHEPFHCHEPGVVRLDSNGHLVGCASTFNRSQLEQGSAVGQRFVENGKRVQLYLCPLLVCLGFVILGQLNVFNLCKALEK